MDSVKDSGSEPGVRGDVSPPARQQQLKIGITIFQKINVLPNGVVLIEPLLAGRSVTDTVPTPAILREIRHQGNQCRQKTNFFIPIYIHF
jgi:hypothetical protein